MKEGKREVVKEAYGGDDYGGVTPLGMVDGSKMSGEERKIEFPLLFMIFEINNLMREPKENPHWTRT